MACMPIVYLYHSSVSKKHDENDSIEINESRFIPFTEFHDEDSFEEINLDEELLDVPVFQYNCSV